MPALIAALPAHALMPMAMPAGQPATVSGADGTDRSTSTGLGTLSLRATLPGSFGDASQADAVSTGLGTLSLVSSGDAMRLGGSSISEVSALSAMAQPVPEPGTWALLATGLGLLAWRAGRRPSSPG